MIKNYLKITLRTLRKNKIYTIINITGLALSIAICLMILIYILDQKNVDRFHTKKDRIVRIYTTDQNSSVSGWATTPGPVKEFLIANYPYVESVVRFCRTSDNILNTTTPISINGFFAESEFFSVFDFSLKSGDPESALQKPNSIVISEQTAGKIFPAENPLGKMIHLEDLGDYIITGILSDSHYKSHLVFDFLISFSTFKTLKHLTVYQSDYFNIDKWTSFRGFYHYILLENRNDIERLERSLETLKKNIFPQYEQNRFGFKLQRLSEINFGLNLVNPMSGTKHTQDVILIPVIAIIIIFLACFNYIILSIARSLRRVREIGLRKVLGSERYQIVKLFLSEAFVLTFISLIIACLLLLILVPIFNDIDIIKLNDQQINLDFMKNFIVYLLFVAFAIGVSLIAGLYPALYLSSFLPVNALKGISEIDRKDRFLTRKILMTIQFVVSIVAISLIVILYKQHLYMVSYDKGISTKHTAFIRLRNANHELFRNELMKHPDITGVSFSSIIPVSRSWGSITVKSDKMDESVRFDCFSVDAAFAKNFRLAVLAGEYFQDDGRIKNRETVILNATAVEHLGFNSAHEALGKTVEVKDPFLGEETRIVQIIAVLKDFNYKTLYESIGPLLLQNNPHTYHYASVHYRPEQREKIRIFIENIAEKFIDIQPLEIQFYEDVAEAENNILREFVMISVWCCGFIILIALMGLLGMVMYTSEMRVKEIGIRKVLGATVPNLSYLLGKEYIVLILFAAAIATPIAWFSGKFILQAFAFRTSLSLWIFPAVLFFAGMLALITISSQTIKAAIANPAITLRDE